MDKRAFFILSPLVFERSRCLLLAVAMQGSFSEKTAGRYTAGETRKRRCCPYAVQSGHRLPKGRPACRFRPFGGIWRTCLEGDAKPLPSVVKQSAFWALPPYCSSVYSYSSILSRRAQMVMAIMPARKATRSEGSVVISLTPSTFWKKRLGHSFCFSCMRSVR